MVMSLYSLTNGLHSAQENPGYDTTSTFADARHRSENGGGGRWAPTGTTSGAHSRARAGQAMLFASLLIRGVLYSLYSV
eukprot:scaffold114373_cov70-Phaeocystis_antarctica.AAC.3